MRTVPADEADLVPLDDGTADRLERFATATGKTPAQAAALLLRDLLWDPDFWQAAAVGDGTTHH